jgi:hypothetical protein
MSSSTVADEVFEKWLLELSLAAADITGDDDLRRVKPGKQRQLAKEDNTENVQASVSSEATRIC